MSTTISTTQVKTIPPRAVTKLQNEERPYKLVRSSSIEKIKRFNNYICSQHFYVLPALLTWLKSSQSNLHSSTEKTIFFFRSLLFNSLLYKLFAMGMKFATCAGHVASLKFKEVTVTALTKSFKSTVLLRAEVYLAVATVIAQMVFCAYILTFVVIPVGLFFLLGCIAYISHLSFTTTCGKRKTKTLKNNAKKNN